MREDVRVWWKKALSDCSDAEYNFQGKRYQTAVFLCQQAAEKALKAVLIASTETLRKTHDLVDLGRQAGLPQPLMEKAQELTMAYTYARYPDLPEKRYLDPIVRDFLACTKEVLSWSKKQLSSGS